MNGIMPTIAFDVSRELRMVMFSLQHETSQSSDGKAVDKEKLNEWNNAHHSL